MKNLLSLIACALIAIVLLAYRVNDITPEKPLKITQWDANGYYLYLPSILIYHDYKKLDWLAEIDHKYQVTGNGVYEAQKADNGNYVFKYLGGVAQMELPFFFIGHYAAKHYGYPQDGFSAPYQYALGFGVLLYSLLAILLLRKILLLYFSDGVTAITLLLVCLATNYIQYAAIDSGQSHAYIFLLYVLVLYTTLRWHRQPSMLWACLTGYIMGLATMSRPTEAIILFIPLLWNTHTKEAAKEKWQLVRQHRAHIAAAVVCGILGVLPQLLYWKAASGAFVYDVGSKWEFLTPHFQVLFGFEKGWFIYTPITLLFVVALFLNKRFPFSKSAIWFCMLNIYIIIAWHDWHYGGSYSARALVQSYPVFALPFAALTDRIIKTKWRIPFYVTGTYLLAVNLFQIIQYCQTIIHYNAMNRRYYSHVYLNPHPTPLDMSLLDDDEYLPASQNYKRDLLLDSSIAGTVHFAGNTEGVLAQLPLVSSGKQEWLEVEGTIDAPSNLWQSYLNADLKKGDSVKHTKVRLLNGLTEHGRSKKYAFYMYVPPYFDGAQLKVYLTSPNDFDGVAERVVITGLYR